MARSRALSGILLLSLLFAVPALAQRVASTIRGTVKDTSGAVIVGAKVAVRNEATGLARASETNASGSYAFADLPIGTYSIAIDYPGFKSSLTKGILLNVADVREIDIKLEAGAISESVSVEVPAVSVKTIGGDVSSIITGAQVRELPLNGRNFLQLALLMPGVNAIDNVNVKDKGLLGGSDISVSGSAVTSNLWTVDGANNNDVGSNRTILVYPSLEAIEEFKVQRSSYSAEFGQASGGQVNIVTRGGTNEFHGGIFYFGRNDALNSTNYFLKQANRPKDELIAARLRLERRRPDHQGQAALLRLAGVQQGEARHRALRVRADGGRAAGRLQRARHRGLHAVRADRPGDGRRIPRQPDPGEPAERGWRQLPSALSAAEHDAGRGQLQQLGRLAHDAARLAPGEHPARLDAQQHDPPDGPLHAGLVDEQLAEPQHEPLG